MLTDLLDNGVSHKEWDDLLTVLSESEEENNEEIDEENNEENNEEIDEENNEEIDEEIKVGGEVPTVSCPKAISAGTLIQHVDRIISFARVPIDPIFIQKWKGYMELLSSKICVHTEKIVRQVSDMKIRAQEIYKEIIQYCDTDEKILRIHRLITNGPISTNKKISGRTIDTLVTRFPRDNDVCYYLDITDPDNIVLLDPNISTQEVQRRGKEGNRRIILFDIGSSYRSKMYQYTKTYFDCFGRGHQLEHTLHSGGTIPISICQFTFFIWADKFKVFDFLTSQYDPVVIVRKQSQKNAYKPKRKKATSSDTKDNTKGSNRPGKRRKKNKVKTLLVPQLGFASSSSSSSSAPASSVLVMRSAPVAPKVLVFKKNTTSSVHQYMAKSRTT